MAKFKIALERWVQQTGIIEVEAETIEEAVDEIRGDTENEAIVWESSETDETIWGSAMEIGNDCPYFAENLDDKNDTWERD